MFKSMINLLTFAIFFANCQAQNNNIMEEPCGYKLKSGFVNLEKMTFETKPLSPEMNFKNIEPQANFFRILGSQNMPSEDSVSVQNHTFTLSKEATYSTTLEGKRLEKWYFTVNITAHNKTAQVFPHVIVGKEEDLNPFSPPHWIVTANKAILVVFQKEPYRIKFYVFDGLTGNLLHTITNNGKAKDFRYVYHLDEALWYKYEQDEQFTLLQIDLTTGKIKEFATRKENTAAIIVHQIPKSATPQASAESVNFFSTAYFTEYQNQHFFCINLLGSVIRIPIMKELSQQLSEKAVVALMLSNKMEAESFWFAFYNPFASGVELYYYNLHPKVIDGDGLKKLDTKYYAIGHSEYYNQVYLSVYKDKILLEGDESSIHYLQIFDRHTQERIADF